MFRCGSYARSSSGLGCYSLLENDENQIYVFGRNYDGDLGLECSEGYRVDPQKFKHPSTSPVKEIAQGGYHSILLTEDGEIFTWGMGCSPKPCRVVFKTVTCGTPILIGCGAIFSVVTTNEVLLVWENTNENALGEVWATPQKIKLKNNSTCQPVSVSCGSCFFLLLYSDGSVYSWGNNKNGQLGIGNVASHKRLQRVTFSSQNFDFKVHDIACGSKHSLALTNDGLWVWGASEDGRLGLGFPTTDHQITPCKLTLNPGCIPMAIACGGEHSLVLMLDGSIYSWGCNRWGQLGIGSLSNSYHPQKVNLSVAAIAISCGYNHSLVLGVDGSIYSFGRNTDGRLGIGHISEVGARIEDSLPNKIPMITFQKKVDLSIFYINVIKTTTKKLFGDDFPIELVYLISFNIFNLSKRNVFKYEKEEQDVVDRENIEMEKMDVELPMDEYYFHFNSAKIPFLSNIF